MLPNLRYDYSREAAKTGSKNKLKRLFVALWSPGFQAVMSYRICRWLCLKHIPLVHMFIQRWTEITTGISIPPTAEIGKGLLIEHFGGIVVNSRAKVGEFCVISHCVTVGNQRPQGRSPVIGNNVYIGVGAKVLGDISIGDNCIIGANAVVLKSMPANSIVTGMPARAVKTITNKEVYKEFFYEN